jgi:hypothetical protein
MKAKRKRATLKEALTESSAGALFSDRSEEIG